MHSTAGTILAKETNLSISNLSENRHPQLKYEDAVFRKEQFNETRWSAPLVIKEYKLIFFSIPKVGCTEWKLLFRLMMGYSHHDTSKDISNSLHNPKLNGLTYLSDFEIEEAHDMLTSDEWTRAVFVREPKERILSAFLDKFVANKDFCGHCSKNDDEELECLEKRQMARRKNRNKKLDMPYFLETALTCEHEFRDHWLPQYHLIDQKWWPYINFIGYMDNATAGSEQLLRSLTSTKSGMNAWDQYGTSGWGRDGENAFMARQENSYHSRNAKDKLRKQYDPCTEAYVEKHWAIEWEGNDFYHFDKFRLFNETLSGNFKEGCEMLNRTESSSW